MYYYFIDLFNFRFNLNFSFINLELINVIQQILNENKYFKKDNIPHPLC